MTSQTGISPDPSVPATESLRQTILAVGFSDAWLAELRRGLAPLASTAPEREAVTLAERLHAVSAEQAGDSVRRGEVAVMLLGPDLEVAASRQLVMATLGVAAADATQSLVLGAGDQAQRFQELVALDRVFYLAASPPPIADVVAMVASAERRHARAQAQVLSVDTQTAAGILEWVGSLAREDDLAAVARQAARRAAVLVDADHAVCWIYDQASETVWSPPPSLGEDERRESAAAGLVSFTVRTGRSLRLPRVSVDSRFDADIDSWSEGSDDDAFLAVPVLGRLDSSAPRTVAALVAHRPSDRQDFSAYEERCLRLLADHLAPLIERLLRHGELRSAANRQAGLSDEQGLFRAEAIDHYYRELSEHGRVLELSPTWMHHAYRVLLGLIVVALGWSWWGTIDEYAEGVGVVRVDGRRDVTSSVAGTVAAVEVEPGDRVRAGQLLVRLYGAQEAAELRRVRREFELGLLNRLRYPADPLAARTLSALRLQQEVAESRLDERSVRAQGEGVVSDLRVRQGQLLSPGDVVLSLEGERSQLGVVSVIPGHYRPLIEVGMPLRLELNGYRYAYQELRVDSVSDEVFGPAEARRILGPGIGDAIPVTGPVVLVQSHLTQPTFVSGGRVYAYHDGILGRAEVRVRSERILLTLIPGLRTVFGG